MAAWIKMSLGMELGLGPGDFVLDGDPVALSPKGHSPPPIFGPYLFRPHWIEMSLDLGPGDCVRWGPRSPYTKGGRSPQIFDPCL